MNLNKLLSVQNAEIKRNWKKYCFYSLPYNDDKYLAIIKKHFPQPKRKKDWLFVSHKGNFAEIDFSVSGQRGYERYFFKIVLKKVPQRTSENWHDYGNDKAVYAIQFISPTEKELYGKMEVQAFINLLRERFVKQNNAINEERNAKIADVKKALDNLGINWSDYLKIKKLSERLDNGHWDGSELKKLNSK